MRMFLPIALLALASACGGEAPVAPSVATELTPANRVEFPAALAGRTLVSALPTRDSIPDVGALLLDARIKLNRMRASSRAANDPAYREKLAYLQRLLDAYDTQNAVELNAALQAEHAGAMYASAMAALASQVNRRVVSARQVDYGIGNRTLVRIFTDGSAPFATMRMASLGGGCEYPPGTPEEEMAMECVDGYDPNYDSTADMDSVAVLTMTKEGYVTTYGDSATGPPSGGGGGGEGPGEEPELRLSSLVLEQAFFSPRMALACNGEFWEYAASVGAFVGTSAGTIFWALRKNPTKAATWLWRAGASLVAVVITAAYLGDCLAE